MTAERRGAARQAAIDAERDECRRRPDVAELRERIAVPRMQMRGRSDSVLLARVLDHVGDIELAAAAILMEPRPTWLKTLIGYDLMRVYPAKQRR